MTPTIGRIVIYVLTEQDAERVNALPRASCNGASAGDEYPAVVVRAWSATTVNLKVLLDGTPDLWATSRLEGATPGTWHWPPRVTA